LNEKIKFFRKFAWKNRFFLPGCTTPLDFKPDWRRWYGWHRLAKFTTW